MTQPVNASDAFFNNALDFLEDVRIFLVYPVCHVSSIIKDLKKKIWLTNFCFWCKQTRARYWFLKVPCLAPSPQHLHSDQCTTRSHPRILLSMQTLENLPWRAENKTNWKRVETSLHAIITTTKTFSVRQTLIKH